MADKYFAYWLAFVMFVFAGFCSDIRVITAMGFAYVCVLMGDILGVLHKLKDK